MLALAAVTVFAAACGTSAAGPTLPPVNYVGNSSCDTSTGSAYKNVRAQFVKLWKEQPHRDLPFRFGYPDNAKHNHLMITRPAPK